MGLIIFCDHMTDIHSSIFITEDIKNKLMKSIHQMQHSTTNFECFCFNDLKGLKITQVDFNLQKLLTPESPCKKVHQTFGLRHRMS